MVQLTGKQIEEIAGEIECGIDCYIHTETGEVVSIPNELLDEGVFRHELEKIEKYQESYLLIEPLDPHDSFKIMEDFTYTVEDEVMKERLQTALERPKPFANFRFDLDSSPELKKKWYEYKHQKCIEHVRLMLRFLSSETILDEEIDDEE